MNGKTVSVQGEDKTAASPRGILGAPLELPCGIVLKKRIAKSAMSDSLGGGVTAWYSMRLTALGDDAEHSFTLTPADALRIYKERDAEHCVRWLKAFPDV
ncbi:MAG: hypothetical protein CMM46_13700 [Rhodospirillaceae bacterium]|nr:hypothetical protein [Rhodospirillaceae bacterium]|tara:strand:+ start:803 stop:1102 length:300 start_codon:yes stop_codon:yes gene_type:complete